MKINLKLTNLKYIILTKIIKINIDVDTQKIFDILHNIYNNINNVKKLIN